MMDPPADSESRTYDRKMGPCRAPSAPAPPGCRSPCAYRSRPPPATPACPGPNRSSQQLDHLAQRLRRHLAANTNSRAVAELDLDKPGTLNLTPRPAARRLRHDLDRHHCTAIDYLGGLFRHQLPPPFEQLVGVHIVASGHDRHRRARLQRLRHTLTLQRLRPDPPPTSVSVHYAVSGHSVCCLCHPPIMASMRDRRQALLTERLRPTTV